jgi:hypothetical protein
MLLNCTPEKSFAKEFVLLRGNSFKHFHNGLIISNSHGIDFFSNVIKHWDNPISYIEKLTEKELQKYINGKERDDYEKNFILILIQNKS